MNVLLVPASTMVGGFLGAIAGAVGGLVLDQQDELEGAFFGGIVGMIVDAVACGTLAAWGISS